MTRHKFLGLTVAAVLVSLWLGAAARLVAGAAVQTTLPGSLTLTDNVYGTITLSYVGGRGLVSDPYTWVGCAQIRFGGTGRCPSVSMPLYYSLQILDPPYSLATLNMSWYGNYTGCPDPGHSCGEPMPAPLRSAAVPIARPGGTMSWSLTTGAGPHPNGSAASQTITMP